MSSAVARKSWIIVLVTVFLAPCQAFVIPIKSIELAARPCSRTSLCMATPAPPEPDDDDDSSADPEGADLAAQLFQMAQAKGVSLDANDLVEDEEEEEEGAEEDGDDDEEEPNIPQGAINAFLGYDTGDVGDKLAGNVSLTDDQLYSEVKERVLDTAGGFLDFVKGASDEDEEKDDEQNAPKEYKPPTNVPDSDLTAGEVVLQVLESLKNNDNPKKNSGVEILFGYSSSGSQIKNEQGLTADEYADFLKETEYKVLFDHQEVVSISGRGHRSTCLERYLIYWRTGF